MRNAKWPAPLRVIGKSVVDWWDGWMDFVVITVVWFFAQFTVILGPPATFGVYHVIHLMAREGQATGIRGMIQGARMYFGKALLWGLINLVAIFLASYNLWFYWNVSASTGNTLAYVAFWLVILLTITYFVMQFYAVAFFMQMKDDQKKIFLAMRNALFLALGTPVYTFVLILFSVLIVLLSFTIIPVFFGIPAIIAVLGTRGMIDRLEHFKLLKKDPDPREVP